MPKKIQLTPQELQTQSKEMVCLSEQYNSLFSNVSNELNTINSNWSPNLSNNFSGKIISVQKSFEKLTDSLNTGANLANSSAMSFEKIDKLLAMNSNDCEKVIKPTSGSDSGHIEYGYEKKDDGFISWIDKYFAKAFGEFWHAEINAYSGKVEGTLGGDFKIGDISYKKEYKKDKKSKKYDWEDDSGGEVIKAVFSAGISVFLYAFDGKAGIGNDMIGIEIEGDGSVLKGSAKGEGKFSVGDEGLDLYLDAEAMASALEGELKLNIDILGIRITPSVGGYAGAVGGEAKIGINDGAFEAKAGVAALLGASVGVKVGLNDEGKDNLLEIIDIFDDYFLIL